MNDSHVNRPLWHRAAALAARVHENQYRKDGRTLELPSLRFKNGEATTWLVTHDDISGYDRLVITSPEGDVLANASIAEA